MSGLSALLSEVDGLTEDQLVRLVLEARQLREDASKSAYWQNLCDNGSRDEIIAAAQDYSGCHAIGLAEDYDQLDYGRELVAWAVRYHPRRPVLMRGGKSGLAIAHALSHRSNPNGKCIALFWRYFRMRKVTAFSRDDLPDWLDDVRRCIRERNPAVTSVFFDRTTPAWSFVIENACWINGRQKFLGYSERRNLQSLYRILQKTKRLEDRIAAAKLHWKERMRGDV